jgi:ATP-dependent DNA helicase RecG
LELVNRPDFKTNPETRPLYEYLQEENLESKSFD